MPYKKGRQSGFTLLEVMVALSIGVMLIYTITSILHTTQSGWLRAHSVSQTIKQNTLAEQKIRDVIDLMVPQHKKNNQHSMLMNDDSFELTIIPFQSTSEYPYLRANLKVVMSNASSDKNLVLSLSSKQHASNLPMVDDDIVLLKGIKDAEFRYFHIVNNQLALSEGEYNTVPELIEFTWTYVDGDRANNVMVLHPKVSDSSYCQIDYVSLSCH